MEVIPTEFVVRDNAYFRQVDYVDHSGLFQAAGRNMEVTLNALVTEFSWHDGMPTPLRAVGADVEYVKVIETPALGHEGEEK